MSPPNLHVPVPLDLTVPADALMAETRTVLSDLLGITAPPLRLFKPRYHGGKYPSALVPEQLPLSTFSASTAGLSILDTDTSPGTVTCWFLDVPPDAGGPCVMAEVDRSKDSLRYAIAAAFTIAVARRVQAPLIIDEEKLWVETDRETEDTGSRALPLDVFTSRLKAPSESETLEQATELFVARMNEEPPQFG